MAISANKPLVLLGGSFDPVHRGHIDGALAAAAALHGSVITLLPNAQSPLKASTHASREQRLAMLELALANQPLLTLSRYEIDRPAPSYTVDTLRHFRQTLGTTPLILVLGADSFAQLERWKDWQAFPSLCHLLVLPRPHAQPPSAQTAAAFPEATSAQLLAQPAGLRLMLAAPLLDISSTALRKDRAMHRRSLAPEVAAYIHAQGLYLPNLGR